MKYIIGLHALIFLIVILMGCNSTPNRSILRQVESYMEEHPDSALFLLNSIAHPEKLSGREQAEYALFYTQSCEKNFILQLNDSLIKIAVDYFESQAGGLKTAQSYFYIYVYIKIEMNMQTLCEHLLKHWKMPLQIYEVGF